MKTKAQDTSDQPEAQRDQVQGSWDKHLQRTRARIDERKAERDAKRAEHHTRRAEAYVLGAIDLAASAIEEAEYLRVRLTFAQRPRQFWRARSAVVTRPVLRACC